MLITFSIRLKHAPLRQVFGAAISIGAALSFSSCGTTTQVTRQLPAYEPRIGKADFETIRTTAYTHTEADHLAYGNKSALGSQLRAASAPIRRAEYVPRALPVTADVASDYQLAAYRSEPQPFSFSEDQDEPPPKAQPAKTKRAKAVPKAKAVAHAPKSKKTVKRATVVRKPKPPVIGSAAADWSRWPAGTTFRLLSTGQIYRVDDYGWALAGRNTIDLYMANSRDMNAWGTRTEPIQVLQWGDPEESLQRLAPHTGYKHIRRMVLELQGQDEAAARLQ